jgi:hypothetical protein
VANCIFCDALLNEGTKPEHILLNALGGRKATTRVVCSRCNGSFGSTIDNEVTDQVEVLRNMLGLESGSGKLPPALRQVKAGTDTINLKGDGTLELVAKPFEITQLADGSFNLNITARSIDDLAEHVPNIAAKLKCSEEKVIEILGAATATNISRRPGVVHFPMSFGGELAIRSFAKSCLVSWATAVGNDEVKSAVFDATRNFVVNGDDAFNRARSHLDSRHVPHLNELKYRFGEFFNLIYIRSDEVGRVVGHFTLYNVMAWQMVLAEGGGTPNLKVGLISNPIEPRVWSDTIADEIDIDFAWLNNPDYSDNFVRARERLSATVERSQKDSMAREFESIARVVFKKHGIAELTPETDPALVRLIVGEISQRAAHHVMNLPHEETVPGQDIVARLQAIRGNPNEN